MPTITPQFLLQGAAYALEQCGLLLRDANALYRDKSYASAVFMAAFAWEALGQWKILLGLRKKIIGGEQVTANDVKKQCDDHVAKQRAGMLSTTIRGSRKLVMDLASAAPGSPEWQAADEEVQRVVQQLRKRTPDERHSRRMAALYVDPLSLTEWSRPSTMVTQEAARQFLTDAANDYSVQCERYTNLKILEVVDAELSGALAQWSDRPKMLPPEQPAYG